MITHQFIRYSNASLCDNIKRFSLFNSYVLINRFRKNVKLLKSKCNDNSLLR